MSIMSKAQLLFGPDITGPGLLTGKQVSSAPLGGWPTRELRGAHIFPRRRFCRVLGTQGDGWLVSLLHRAPGQSFLTPLLLQNFGVWVVFDSFTRELLAKARGPLSLRSSAG